MSQEELPLRRQPSLKIDAFDDLSESQRTEVTRRIAYVIALEDIPPWKRRTCDVEATLAAVSEMVGDNKPARLATVRAWRARFHEGGRHPASLVDLRRVGPRPPTDDRTAWVDAIIAGLCDLRHASGRPRLTQLIAYAENLCRQAASAEGHCITEVPSRSTLRRKIGARMRPRDHVRHQVRRPIAAYPLAEVRVHEAVVQLPELGAARIMIGEDSYSGVIVAALIDISGKGEEMMASLIDSFGGHDSAAGCRDRIVARACQGLPATLILDLASSGLSPAVQECAARRGIAIASLTASQKAAAGPLVGFERWVAASDLFTSPEGVVTAMQAWLVQHDNGRVLETLMTRRERWSEGVARHGVRMLPAAPPAADMRDAPHAEDQGPGSL